MKKVIVGRDLGHYPSPDKSYLTIGPKQVEFEDGRIVDVVPFVICRSCMTIGDFQEFARATGLVTWAERQDDETYFENQLLSPIRIKDRVHFPAYQLTFDEARRYCAWAGGRLPTEAEWLAAAIIDDRVMTEAEYEEYYRAQHPKPFVQPFESHPRVLFGLNGYERVVSDNPVQPAVTRSGPSYVRVVGWKEQAKYHRHVSRGGYDLTIKFRMVKPIS